MKNIREQIEIMEAYESGEKIQAKAFYGTNKWIDEENPKWSWNVCDYRVKPKNKYTPFKTFEDFFKAQDIHGITLKCIETNKTYKSYINNHKELLLLDKYNWFINNISFVTLFNEYVFEDGTPCGKEVSEQ